MGLTRPRAYQIFDIDYKQSVRVVTVSNVTLGGGAPSTVDGVALSLNDRVLVTGQSTGSQNGLYYVTTVGTGSNGTWARSVDGNETGEIEAGMIVMVTDGTVWADTSWKLTTNDPITIGTTALVFEQNTGDAFGNIYANGTAILANTASGSLTLSAGNNISITGNNTSKTITIESTAGGGGGTPGGANTEVQFNDGGVFGGSAGLTFNKTTNAVATTGTLSATGNITGGNIIGTLNGSGANVTSISATNISTGTLAQARLANSAVTLGSTALTLGATVTTVAGLSSVTSTTFVGALTGSATSATTAGTVTTAAQPNITSVGTLSSLSVTANVTGGNLTTGAQVVATGNITGGNLKTSSIVIGGTTITGATSVTSTTFVGALTGAATTAGTVTTAAQPNITSVGTLSSLAVTGNTTSGNFIGTLNGSGANVTSISATNISSGTLAQARLANSAVTLGSTALTLGSTVTTVAGLTSVTSTTFVGALTGAATTAGTVTTAAQPNITSVGTLSSLAVTANITGGNVIATHYGSGAGLTSIPGANVSGTVPNANNSAYLNSITAVNLYNNMGEVHGARTAFDATTPSYDFGYRYVQGSTNGPGTSGSQFYSWYIGLGSQYPATGAGSYGAMFAVDRNVSNPYLSVRYNESNSFGTWKKIYAGFADTAGTVTTAAQPNITSTGTLSSLSVTGNITSSTGHVGTIYTNSIINTGANATGNIGSSTLYFNTAFVKATSAQYADLAEMYVADVNYVPGTVVEFGGNFEITQTTTSCSTAVAGIISTNPSYLMNSCQEGEHVLPVALTGRVPCQVLGPVKKGDVLISSNIPGTAQRIGANWQPGCTVGKAMENINESVVKVIEVAVGRL